MARRTQAPPAPERTDSRGSVNFSYPTSLQRRVSHDDDEHTSERLLTPVRPAIDLNEMVYDSNTRSFKSRGDLLLYEQRLRDASRAQVSPQRKKSMRNEGTHLAQGSVGGRMRVAPHAMETARRRQPGQPQQQEEEHILPRTLRQHAPATDPVTEVLPRQDHIPQQTSPRKQRQSEPRNRQRSNTASDNESDASEQRMKNSRKILQHQPSVVREVQEPQDNGDKAEKVLGSQATVRHVGHQDTVHTDTPAPATRRRHGSVDTTPAPVVIPEKDYSTMVPQNMEEIEIPHDAMYDSKAEAEAAKAAARQEVPAHGASLGTEHKASGSQYLSPTDLVGNLRHNPPARSVSPRKSALKHSNSRGPSPLGENPEGWTAGHGGGDLSDASTNTPEGKPMRKKSVRVSFDEGSNVVVTEPEMPARRIWSGGLRNRSNSPSEESEGMGPRPNLPVFGSVRKEKKLVVEDRPLVVKPHEASNASSVDMGSEHTFGPSSDHKLGAVLTQDFAGKPKTNEPNTSKSREPLPPIVTSREDSGFQSGYQSDSEESNGSVQVAQAVAVEIPEAEREPMRTPKGHRKARFHEHLSSESETPRKDKQSGGLFAPENAGGTTPGSYRLPSEGETPPMFTPPEDENMLMLTKEAAADAIAHGTPPNLIVTVPTPVTEQDEWRPSMPGGLTDWDSPTTSPIEEQKEMSLDQYMAVQDATPAAVGIAEPEVVSHAPGAPVVGEIAAQAEEVLMHDRQQAGRPRSTSAASNRSENESVYSDAAEHLTDTEGDGFMSLDAVVDSPTSPKIEERFVAPAPVSPTRTAHSPTMHASQKRKEEVDGDWVKTQLYWSSLSDEKKRKLEAEARKLAEEEATTASSEDETTYTKQKQQTHKQQGTREALKLSPPPKMAPLQRQQQTGSPDRQYQIAPGTKGPPNVAPASPAAPSNMRQSMRAPKSAVLESGRMRSSLRGPPPAQVRERPASASQYQAPPRNYYQAGSGSLNANSRYSTQPAAPPPVPAKPTPREQAIALVQAQQIAMRRMQEEKQAQKPTLRRRGSGDSDSSFKRERAGGNGFFAKTSMRGNQQGGQRAASVGGPPPADRGRNRYSVRSLSPVGRKGMGGGIIQAPSAAAGLTTLRGNRPAAQKMVPPVQEPPKSSGGFFGRKKGKTPPVSGGLGKSKRFADSDSDEDAPRPQRFSSRFADSSDEDEEPAATMPPVSMKNRSFRGKGATASNSERPKSAMEFGGVGGRPANPRKPSRVLEEDSSDLEDIDDEETREKTRLNSIQGIEAQAAQKGVHPEAVRLAQAYFGAGMLNTSEKYSGTGTSTAESAPVRRLVTPPTPGFTTSQTSLSPGRNSVPTPNFQKDKKSPEGKKKGGVMSFLSRKRKDKNDKVGKRDAGEDSGARQGTALERSRLDLEAARRMEEPPTPCGPAGPGGSKLRKKGVPQLEGGRPGYGRAMSGSFNATVQRSSEIEPRPQTSEGLIAHALTTGPIDGVDNGPLPRPTHEKTTGPTDGVSSVPILPQHEHPTTGGPIDGVSAGPILPHHEHPTPSGPLDGVPVGKERPSVLRRGTSASAVHTLGGEGKKKEKKKGFLRRMFDL